MFAVNGLDDTLTGLHGHGAQLVTKLSSTKASVGLLHQGPEGILIGLAGQIS
jgi:hypothetical protein